MNVTQTQSPQPIFPPSTSAGDSVGEQAAIQRLAEELKVQVSQQLVFADFLTDRELDELASELNPGGKPYSFGLPVDMQHSGGKVEASAARVFGGSSEDSSPEDDDLPTPPPLSRSPTPPILQEKPLEQNSPSLKVILRMSAPAKKRRKSKRCFEIGGRKIKKLGKPKAGKHERRMHKKK